MAKSIPDSVLDLQLGLLEGDRVCVCAGQPTTYTEAVTTFNLVTQAVVGGDFVYANGDTSGRKWTLTPPIDSSIATGGTADHVAIVNVSNELRHITTCPDLILVQGQTVTINAYSHEVGDPV